MGNTFKTKQVTLNGDKLTIEGLRLISDGSGVGYINGIATFVPRLLPGETAEVLVSKTKKRWQRARLVRIIKNSPLRIEAPCSEFERCGGCQLQHTTYNETLLWKKRWVEDALARIGKITVQVKPPIGMEYPWRYRNKARLHRTQTGELGYFEEKSKALVSFKDCHLLSESMNRWIKLTKNFFRNGYPELVSLTFRENAEHEGLLILEGISSKILSVENNPDFFQSLSEQGVRSVWGIDTEGRIELLWGDDKVSETILGLNFELSPLSFLQVNLIQTEVLYKIVLEAAALTGKEIVWDLYSGIGTLTLVLASEAKKVVGIEENPYAVDNAIQNAIMNHSTDHVEFMKGKVEHRMMDMKERPDVVVLDPPRAGIHVDVLKRLLELKAKRIVYVSCDAGTLARDLGGLATGGYKVKSVQPVDMFPWTQHIEIVALLQRKHTTI